MTRKEIIDGLKMTRDLFLFDPSTGDVLTDDLLDDLNRTTVDACRGAIKLLEGEFCEDCISREDVLIEIKRRRTAFLNYDEYSNFFDFVDDMPPVLFTKESDID